MKYDSVPYQLTLESIPDPSIVCDNQGNIVAANREFEKTFGWELHEIQGKLLEFLLQQVNIFEENVTDLSLDKNVITQREAQQATKSGQVLDVRVSVSILRDSSGGITGALIILRNLTEQREKERLLRASEQRLLAAFDASPVPIITYDMAGLVTYINPAFEITFGWSRDELLGNIIDFVPEERLLEYAESSQHLLTHDQIVAMDTQRFKKDGHRLDINLNSALFRDHNQTPIGSVEILQDITHRKHKERLLRASEQRLLAAFDASPVPIITYDMAGLVTYINPAFEITFGWSRDELLGNIIDFVPEERLLEYAESSQHLLTHDQIVAMDTQRFKKDGHRLDINLNSALFRDHNQTPIGSVEILQDITHRKHLEHTLQQAKDSAERANRAKSIFLANMSHEIRTPMNAILGYAQIMMRDSDLQAQWHQKLSIINQSGEHLLGLIDDILELSKIESGQLSLNLRHFDLHTLIYDLGDLFTLETDSKQLQLIVEIMPKVPQFIYADDGKIRQILINLLSNAIKFTDSGSVSLSARVLDSQSTQQQLEFKISDTGEGIPLAQQQHIFEYFQQANTAKERGGAGLGLAISREYARLMGGDVQVESKIGSGSTFRFTCLIERGQEQRALTGRSKKSPLGLAPNQGSIRVLIVDDEPSNRDVLLQLLQPLGLTLQEARNGVECIEQFTAWDPHLILLDLVLPDISGSEVAKRIRELPGGQDVIIIIVSASGHHSEYSQAGPSYTNGFLSKPFRYTELIELIESHLEISFKYSEINDPNPAITTISSAQSQVPIPKDLLEKLEKATLLGQINEIDKLITLVEELDTDVAHNLRELASKFNYPSIRDYISKIINGDDQ